MGRKAARTVEYFPHFVKFGKTLFLLEQKWGNAGFSFWFKLLMTLGASTDHFLDCSKETRPGRENWEYLCARMRFPDQKCEEIISWLTERGNLDHELWSKRRIIWCQDFVNNLSEVYAGRTNPLPRRPDPEISGAEKAISGPEMPDNGDSQARNSENGAADGISGKSIPIGRKGGREGGRESPPSSASPSESQEKEASTKADNHIPEEITPMMFEMQEIHRKATGGAELKLTNGEMSDLLQLFRKHDGPSVVKAYRFHQAEKPGKAFGFFLKDFAEYFARAPKPAEPPPPECKYCGAHGGHIPSCNRPGNEAGLPFPGSSEKSAAAPGDFPEVT